MKWLVVVAMLSTSLCGTGTALRTKDPVALKVDRTFGLIQNGKAQLGSSFLFTESELNAWARAKVPTVVPQGVRQPRLELGSGRAVATAQVNFAQLRRASGVEPNWLVQRLIDGERPVRVAASITSSGGYATVHLERVEINGLGVSGSALDFLIRAFFMPLYPNAKINQPFELEDGVERVTVSPTGARVVMKPAQRR